MLKFYTAAAALLLLCAASASRAAPLFDSDEVLAVALKAPFNLIDRERDKEKEYEGTLSYDDPDLGPTTLEAKFSVRGNFRLRRDICRQSQLWVNLKKKQVEGTLFDGQNKLKLVVQCKGSGSYAEYVAREQQAYRIFETLSDLSLATRLLTVTFEDSQEGGSREQLAFFIQHHDRLAEDRDMVVYEEERAERSRLDMAQSSLVSLFMYLVANTDYSLVAPAPGDTCCHNIKLFEAKDGTLYPVPYDYDSTGFVDASYAQPAAGIGQRNIRQRVYRGYCTDDATFEAAMATLRENRERIYAIIGDDRFVSGRSIRYSTGYFDDFYETLEDPDRRSRLITGECR